MKVKKTNLRKGFTLVELLVVIAIIAALAALSTPAITKALKKSALNTSIHNTKQIKTALDLFASDWDGSFPGTTTQTKLTGAPTIAGAGTAFTQLIINTSLDSSDEPLFYCPELFNTAITGYLEPDNNGIITDAECGFSYVPDLRNTSTSAAPLITSKLQAAAAGTGTFYSTLWDHKAIVGRVNGSVKAYRMKGTPGTDDIVEELMPPAGGGTTSSLQDVFKWAPTNVPLQ